MLEPLIAVGVPLKLTVPAPLNVTDFVISGLTMIEPVPALAIVPLRPAFGAVIERLLPAPSIVMTELPVAVRLEFPPAPNIKEGELMLTLPPPPT